MNTHHIVIGANYGDEGKGLMTDYLVRKHGIKTVVRFNGGAQAGHTVVANGERRVFSSFGSGTLAGAKTRLSPDVVLNPFAAIQESHDLVNTPIEIYTGEHSSPITTPVEIRLNQLAEIVRGSNRHGSCGMGINETVTRHLAMQSANVDTNIANNDSWQWLVNHYILRRMDKLNFSSEMKSQMMDSLPGMRESFLKIWKLANQSVYRPRTYEEEMEDMVFEGAQGLALDEENGEFPYVTRSRTGINNALKEISRELSYRPNNDEPICVNVYYMTRAYLTRHGAGPLYCELPANEVSRGVEFGTGRFTDQTNEPNPWQGSLRFAALDVGSVCSRIHQDLADASQRARWIPNLTINASVVITCTDQFPEALLVDEERGTKFRAAMGKLPSFFSHYGLRVSHISTGPSSTDIKELK